MENEKTNEQGQAAENSWYMAGTEGTGKYVVVARSAIGRVGYRDLGGYYRVRAEVGSSDEPTHLALAEKFAGWKPPDNTGGARYSTMAESVAVLLTQVRYALVMLSGYGLAEALPLEVNPDAPEWAKQLASGATPGDVREEAEAHFNPPLSTSDSDLIDEDPPQDDE